MVFVLVTLALNGLPNHLCLETTAEMLASGF